MSDEDYYIMNYTHKSYYLLHTNYYYIKHNAFSYIFLSHKQKILKLCGVEIK